jgi:hypothetical protein
MTGDKNQFSEKAQIFLDKRNVDYICTTKKETYTYDILRGGAVGSSLGS